MPRPARRVAAAAVALLLGGCGAGGDDRAVAFVPSSFTTVADDLDAAATVDATWVIAGSTRLLAQLDDGAPADLLVTADRATMDEAIASGLAGPEHTVIARNRLVLAVAPDNPAAIDTIDDVGDDSLLVGVCAAAVPCGRLATTALADLDVLLSPDTEESNVRALAAKIAGGELDAGFIYATDALVLGLDTVDDDRLAPFVTEYPAALVGDDDDGRGREVVDALRSDAGRAVLTSLGFEVP